MNYKKLDKIFSEYIRRRDAVDEFVQCCTCPSIRHWKEMDCGHFRKRGNLSTRWDEKNAAAQCAICNQSKDGEYNQMASYLANRFGGAEVIKVIDRSLLIWKPMQYEIDDLTEYYKNKIKELWK